MFSLYKQKVIKNINQNLAWSFRHYRQTKTWPGRQEQISSENYKITAFARWSYTGNSRPSKSVIATDFKKRANKLNKLKRMSDNIL